MNILSFFVIDCYYYNFSLFNIFGNQGIPQNNTAEKKNESQIHFLLIGPPLLARRVLWNRVCPSFRPSIHPSVCLGVFLELYH